MWEVRHGQLVIGLLKAVDGGRLGPMYTVKFTDEPDFQDELSDD